MKKRTPSHDLLSRRNLLLGGMGACTSSTMLSTLLDLRLTRSAVAASGDTSGYKALVCMFMNGGWDSYNVLTPYEPSEYSDYVSVRGAPGSDGGLALPRNTGTAADLLPISDSTGRQFGIHWGMTELQDMYNDGDLAFIANTGSMIGPTDKSDYDNRINLPLGLFSHADHQRHWQSTVPQSRTQLTGWAGRMADCLTDTTNSNPTISLNIAVNNLNIMQTGDQVIPYVVNESGGAQLLGGYNGGNARSRILTRVTNNVLSQTYQDLLQQTHATTSRDAVDAAIEFNGAINASEIQTTFPNTQMGRRLQMVARSIGARETLGQRRQIFMVQRGGWDHHQNLIGGQAAMLPEISEALGAFKNALNEMGVFDEVTVFSISDFARTLNTNGQGSDHAWGGNQFIMGGSVAGGDVYGNYPSSLLNPASPTGGNLNLGRGRLIPTTAVDQYYAELAMWFGLTNGSDLETVLPNIRNFHASGATDSPIGFMG